MNTAPDLAQIDRRHLPNGLRRIIDAIGLPAAYKLLQARGGTRIRCVRGPKPSQLLTDLVGADAAARLVTALASDGDSGLRGEAPIISLPKADKLLSQLRDAEIIALDEAGESQAKIALRYDISERWVNKIVTRHSRKRDIEGVRSSRQGDLFS